MSRILFMRTYIIAILITVAVSAIHAADWPMWGGTVERNMASSEKGIVSDFDPGKMVKGTEDIDMSTTKKVKWTAKLGSQSYGNVSVSQGLVFVGTNNESPRDSGTQGDRGILMVFEEKTGKFLYQLIVPKLGAGKVSDWEYIGICSSPVIDGKRGYLVTNRCEVICFDIKGMADGNDGPYKDEGKYMAGEGKPPVEVNDKHADIIWVFDMRDELGSFPHNIASSSPLVQGEYVYTATSNGVDWSHKNIPSPIAPSLIALDKMTGKLVGEEASGISTRVLHASWSSPTFGNAKGKDMLIFGAGDGWVYGFDPQTKVDEDGFALFPELWKFDGNLPEYRMKDGKEIKYATHGGPSEFIATPVFYNNKVYAIIGQDPEHGDGVGRLSCIDANKRGDISKTGIIWEYNKIGRSISTVSIADDLVFAAEYAGKIHCIDANTGEHYWEHETYSRIWSSTLVADGKVFLGNEDGELVILKAGKEKKVINTIEFDAPIYSSCVVANGTLYVATQTHLYAIEE